MDGWIICSISHSGPLDDWWWWWLLAMISHACVCGCGSVCDSVSVVALDTHHHPPSRQYSRSLFLSLSLDKLSGVAPHHQACPRCLSVLLIASLRPPPPPPQYMPHFRHHSINPSINQSSWRLTDLMQHLSHCWMKVLWSQRERERERESVSHRVDRWMNGWIICSISHSGPLDVWWLIVTTRMKGLVRDLRIHDVARKVVRWRKS